MLKLKNRKGSMILEGVVSLFIISLLIFSSFEIYIASYKIKSENKAKDNYINILDAVSKEIIYNKDYHFIEDLNTSSRFYLPCDYMNISSIENNDLSSLFVNTHPDKLPYLYVNVENGDIYKIRLSIYYKKYNGSGEIHSDLYKGKY
ncbi:MAG: hypothetical protein LIR50_00540 [Bacillota bacterium]|nr:hypothetical protein [Bacillota bacterium]